MRNLFFGCRNRFQTKGLEVAGDWIKMRSNLWDDPRVMRLCELTGHGEAMIIGGLYWLWATADQHTENGLLQGLGTNGIDRKTNVTGLGEALAQIGWIEVVHDGVLVVRFEEHNGSSAKRRCTEARRKAHSRNVSAFDADVSRTISGHHAELEKEKRREDFLPVSDDTGCARAKPEPVPPCPQKKILVLYSEELPELTQPRIWTEQREAKLRARWKWLLTATRPDGKRYAHTEDDGLEYFRRLFRYVRDSDFLMGRKGKWAADLEWLVQASNFAKVIDGKYDNREAA